MILYEEGKTPAQQDEAHNVLGLLTLAYPDHPWGVRIENGFIYIRYLDPIWESICRGPVGVVIKAKELYSASQMKKDVLMAGGQLLEMMALKRGYSNGDEPQSIDGVPEKFKKKEVEVPTLVDVTGQPLRTEARPQVGY